MKNSLWSRLLLRLLDHSRVQSCVIHKSMRLKYEPAAGPLGQTTTRSYFTEWIYQSLLGGQLPDKTVNLLFTITNPNIELTVLWGS